MAVPTKQEFDDFARESWRPWETLLWDSVASDIHGSLDQISEDLVAFELNRSYRLKREFVASVDTHSVVKWIEGNPTCSRAWASLYGRRSANQSNSYDAHTHARRLIELATRPWTRSDLYWMRGESSEITADTAIQQSVDRANTDEAKARRVHSAIKRAFNWDPLNDYRKISLALMSYFYEDSYRKYTGKTAESQSAAKALLASISQLSVDELWLQSGVQRFAVRVPLRAIRELEVAATNKSNPAIKKIDGTAPERGLAFELWSEFSRRFRTNKITSIYNFLQFEGITNPPDSRSLERWVKDWNDRKVKLAPTDKRHEARVL